MTTLRLLALAFALYLAAVYAAIWLHGNREAARQERERREWDTLRQAVEVVEKRIKELDDEHL